MDNNNSVELDSQELKKEDRCFSSSEKKQFADYISEFSVAQCQSAIEMLQEKVTFLQTTKVNAEKIINYMKELGISFEDMKRLGYKFPTATYKTKVTPVKNSAVYRIKTEDGVTTSWSGRGRMPIAFRGLTKDEFEQYRIQEDGLTQDEKERGFR